MNKKSSNKNSTHSLAASIVIGVVLSLTASVLLMLLLTSLVAKGNVEENNLQPYTFAIRALSVLIGSLAGTKSAVGKTLPTIGFIACAYLLLIIVFGIGVYGNSFNDFTSGVASVLIGGAVACVVTLKPSRKIRIHRRYAH